MTRIGTLLIIFNDSLNIKVLENQIINHVLQKEVSDTESVCREADYDDSAYGKWRKQGS